MTNRLTMLALVWLSISMCALAQTMPSSVVSSGATRSSNQQFVLNASFAQHAIGTSSNTRATVLSGFWHELPNFLSSTVEQQDSETLRATPQPAQSSLLISFDSAPQEHISIELINLLGERVFQLSDINIGAHFSTTLDVSSLASGTYTLRILREKQTLSRLCIIQH